DVVSVIGRAAAHHAGQRFHPVEVCPVVAGPRLAFTAPLNRCPLERGFALERHDALPLLPNPLPPRSVLVSSTTIASSSIHVSTIRSWQNWSPGLMMM